MLTEEDILMYGGVSTEEEGERELVVPERGALGDIKTGLLRGATSFIGTVAEAGEALGLENSVDEWAEEKQKTSPLLAKDVSEARGEYGFFKNAFQGAVEALPQSIAPAIPGAIAGFAVAGPAGAAIGGLTSMAGIIGLGGGHKAYEEGLEKGLSPEEAQVYGIKKGATEAGLETLSMGFDILTAGSGALATKAGKAMVKELIKRGPKEYAKDMGKMILVENATESAQAEIGQKIDEAYGMKDTPLTWKERLDTMATTTILSVMFGGVAVGYNVNERRKLKNDIESGNIEKQRNAAKIIKDQLEKQDPKMAEQWDTYASDAFKANLPIKIDEDFANKAAEVKTFGESVEAAEAKEVAKMTKAEKSRDRRTQAILSVATEDNMKEIDKVLNDAGIPTDETLEAQEVSRGIKDQEKLSDNVALILEAQDKQRANNRRPMVGTTGLEMMTPSGQVPGTPVNQSLADTIQVGFGMSEPEMVSPVTDKPKKATVTDKLKKNMELQKKAQAEQKKRLTPSPKKTVTRRVKEKSQGKATEAPVSNVKKETPKTTKKTVASPQQPSGKVKVTTFDKPQEGQAYVSPIAETKSSGLNIIEEPRETKMSQKDAQKETDADIRDYRKEAKDPQLDDALDGKWGKGTTLGKEVDRVHAEMGVRHQELNRESRVPTKKMARTKVIQELRKKHPGAIGMVEEELANYERTPEGKTENRTKGNVDWKTSKAGASGTAPDGTRYFVSTEGKNRHVLYKEGEVVGIEDEFGDIEPTIFKSREEAMEASVEEAKDSDYEIFKRGESNFGVKHKGVELSGKAVRSKKGAKHLAKMHAKDPKLGIATAIKDINGKKIEFMEGEVVDIEDVDAYLTEELGLIEEFEVYEESEYGMIPKVVEQSTGEMNIISGSNETVTLAKAFQSILNIVGIKNPNIVVVELSSFLKQPAKYIIDSPSAFVKEQLTEMANRNNSSTFGATNYDPETNTIFLAINESTLAGTLKREKAMVIAHEAGHIIERIMFHQTDQKMQDSVVEAYVDHIMEDIDLNMTRGELQEALRPQIIAEMMGRMEKGKWSGEGMAPWNQFAFGDTLSDYRKYQTSFSEWFADEVAKWTMSTKEPKSALDKFFKGIGEQLKKIYNLIVGRKSSHYAAPSMQKFLDDHVKRTKESQEMGFERSPELSASESIDVMMFHKEMNHMRNELLGFTDVKGPESAVAFMRAETVSEKAKLAAKKGIVAESTEDIYKNFTEQRKRKAKRGLKFKKFREDTAKTAKHLFKSGIDTIGEYSPSMERMVNKYVKGVSEKNAEYKKRVNGFISEFKKLEGTDQDYLGMSLYNGYTAGVKKITDKYPGIAEEIKNVQEVLAEIKASAEEVGHNIDGPLENYWPRLVDDAVALRNLIDGNGGGPIAAQIEEAKRTAMNNGVEWSTAYEEEVISSLLNTGQYYGALSIPGSLKKRGIQSVTSNMYQFYANPVEALNNHILTMNEKIAQTQMIGPRKRKAKLDKLNAMGRAVSKMTKGTKLYERRVQEYVDLKDHLASLEASGELQQSLSSRVLELSKVDKLSDEQATEIIDIIRARMLEKGMHGVANSFRNVGLMTTLGDFTSVITQASEVILNAYANSPKNAMLGLIGKREIDAASLDLKNQQVEFQTEGTAKYLSKLLDMTGFSKVDIYMKESFMTSALLKARKQSTADLKADWGAYFGDDFKNLEKELKSGETGPLSTELAWAKLMRYQPLDVIANPTAYATGGNMRLFYMLKTFQLRQANAIYREGIKKILSGDVKQGVKNLVWLTSLIVVGGATKDEMRDMWLGRSVPMREHIWDNLLNIGMLSRYDTDRFKSEGPAKQILGKILPPAPWIDQPAKAIMKGKPEELLKLTPFIGKFAYDRMTDVGKTNEANRSKDRFNKDIKKAVRNNDKAELVKIRREVLEYWKGKDVEDRMTPSDIRKTVTREKNKIKKERKESGGSVSPTGSYFKNLMALENTSISNKPDEYIVKANKAPEAGGGIDIGFGHKLTGTERSSGKVYGIEWRQGVTVEQSKEILKKDIEKHRALARVKVGSSKFDSLPKAAQDLLTDYSFTGTLSIFKNFRSAIVNGDYKKAKEEYVRKMKGADGSLVPLGNRNKFGLELIEQLKTDGYLT